MTRCELTSLRVRTLSSRYLIGVDAGGSKTQVLLGELVDGQMRAIGSAVGTAGNPRSVGFDVALATIHKTITQAFENAGVVPTTVAHACFSVAGAGRPEEQQRIRDWCKHSQIAPQMSIVGDAECLLAASDGVGIALIAGTGSMAWGRNVAGATARAGGNGYLFDDEGSGYWLAAAALRRVCMAADARRQPTSLLPTILQHLGLSSADKLIAWCYESPDPRRQIASLAPLVFQEYPEDPASHEIVDGGARALAKLVSAVAGELAFSKGNFTLACAGSVLLKQPVYQRLLATELARVGISTQRICWVDHPVEGALQMAFAAATNQSR